MDGGEVLDGLNKSINGGKADAQLSGNIWYFKLFLGCLADPNKNGRLTAYNLFTKGSNVQDILFWVAVVCVIVAVVFLFVKFEEMQQVCPQCGSKKSFKVTNSYKEPKTTFEKKSSSQPSDKSHVNMTVMETGISHTVRTCDQCGYEKQFTKSYEKRIGQSQR